MVDVLEYLWQVHSEPKFIPSNRGQEFVSRTVLKRLDESGLKTLFI